MGTSKVFDSIRSSISSGRRFSAAQLQLQPAPPSTQPSRSKAVFPERLDNQISVNAITTVPQKAVLEETTKPTKTTTSTTTPKTTTTTTSTSSRTAETIEAVGLET